MQHSSHLDTGTMQSILQQPAVCAECGLLIAASQLADECDLCGAPRCRACAADAGEQAHTSLARGYICSSCAAED